jgi:hypothetical protein
MSLLVVWSEWSTWSCLEWSTRHHYRLLLIDLHQGVGDVTGAACLPCEHAVCYTLLLTCKVAAVQGALCMVARLHPVFILCSVHQYYVAVVGAPVLRATCDKMSLVWLCGLSIHGCKAL